MSLQKRTADIIVRESELLRADKAVRAPSCIGLADSCAFSILPLPSTFSFLNILALCRVSGSNIHFC